MTLAELNRLPAADATASLLGCCHARRWAQRLEAERPFATRAALLDAAARVWSDMEEPDLLEAFAGHPRIGDVDTLRARYTNAAAKEQSAVATASDEVLDALARGNLAYERKFGFIFIVFATGRSAVEMLALLDARCRNDRATELTNGAAAQAQILALRLGNLVATVTEGSDPSVTAF